MPLEEAREAAVAAVKKLGEDVGIVMSLKDVVPMEDVDALSADALKDACTPGNPRPVTVEDIKAMLAAQTCFSSCDESKIYTTSMMKSILGVGDKTLKKDPIARRFNSTMQNGI